MVTHYHRILSYVHPSHTHILVDGAFVEHGTGALSERIEKKGTPNMQKTVIDDSYKYGFSKPEKYFYKAPKACRKKLSGLLAGTKRATLDA